MPPDVIYPPDPDRRPSVVREQDIEETFIEKLQDLKFPPRPDIRDRAALGANFCQKFEALNCVRLTDAELTRLLDDLVSLAVFENSVRLRKTNDRMHPYQIYAVQGIVDCIDQNNGNGYNLSHDWQRQDPHLVQGLHAPPRHPRHRQVPLRRGLQTDSLVSSFPAHRSPLASSLSRRTKTPTPNGFPRPSRANSFH